MTNIRTLNIGDEVKYKEGELLRNLKVIDIDGNKISFTDLDTGEFFSDTYYRDVIDYIKIQEK